MRMMTRILIAGLIMGGAAHTSADAEEPGETSLDTPITSIELDAEGNVVRVTFSNGAELSADDLYLKAEEIQDLEVGGIRRLPFQLWKVGDSTLLIADFVGPTPVTLPEGAGAKLSMRPNNQVELSLVPQFRCPWPCEPEYGGCSCPDDLRSFALVNAYNPDSGDFELKGVVVPSQ